MIRAQYTNTPFTAQLSMSHDLSANLQIFSPTGSGRSSPSPRVTRNNAEEGMSQDMTPDMLA